MRNNTSIIDGVIENLQSKGVLVGVYEYPIIETKRGYLLTNKRPKRLRLSRPRKRKEF